MLVVTCAAAAQTAKTAAQNIAALKAKAESGDAKAEFSLGWMYQTGNGVPKDYAKAAQWLRDSAAQGNADAETNLGTLYADGQGVPENFTMAIQWYRKAADQGGAVAQESLGNIYSDVADYEEAQWLVKSKASSAVFCAQCKWVFAQAAYWYRKAANQGDSYAQDELGTIYRAGLGVPTSDAIALQWYRKAADQGNADAEMQLGTLYRWGLGVAQDDARAAMWYREAADHGDADAQYKLGLLYQDGNGVPQDYTEAYFWFDVALASNHNVWMFDPKIAAKDRNDAASHLTPAELSQVQERARKWFKHHPSTPAQ